jgi:CheY-like chemotaxis protein
MAASKRPTKKKSSSKKRPAKAARIKAKAGSPALAKSKAPAESTKIKRKARSKPTGKKNGIDRRSAKAPGRGTAKARPARSKEQLFKEPRDVRLLVVDDEPEVLNLLVPFLKKQGYTVSEAQDGDQALEKILTERPNIVVLDVMMPGLSGWEISRYVRERSELDPVRIIMATGIGKDTNAATSPLYGADAYIDKPFRLDALHRTVRDVIQRIETGTL